MNSETGRDRICVSLPLRMAGNAMDDVLQIELTTHERDVLVRGLRYVKRAIMLETRDPTHEDELRRGGLLDEIQNLSQRLEATDPLTTADV